MHPQKLTHDELQVLGDFISEKMGLHFTPDRFMELERGFVNITKDFGHADASAYLKKKITSGLTPEELDIFARHLTTGETYFYREEERLLTLESVILPELIKQRRDTTKSIRIWSAGCSSGEEPYTIAMILRKLLPDIHKWKISILATDINPQALKKAEVGIYSNWSFRGTPEWLKQNYFTRTTDGKYEVKPEVKKMVTFSVLNLIDDSYPTLFTKTNSTDILFCRNVLMYFSNDTIRKIIDKFYHCIADEGYFLVSLVESHIVTNKGLVPFKIGGSTFFRKTKKHPEHLTPIIHPSELPVFDESEFKINTEEADLYVSPQFLYDMPVEYSVPEPETTYPAEEKVSSSVWDRAKQAFEAGDYDRSVELLAGVSNETDADAMMLLARAYANIGQLETAAEWSNKAVAVDKTNKDYHFYNGTIFQEIGKIEEAVNSFEKVIYLDSEYVIAYFTLALLAKQYGKQKELARYTKSTLLLLQKRKDDDVIEGSEGLSAGRLRTIVHSLIN